MRVSAGGGRPVDSVATAATRIAAEERVAAKKRAAAAHVPNATPKLSFPDLETPRRVFERQNGKQQNIVLVAPETQAHIVLENYTEHAAKRMVALVQPAGNVGAGMWWSSGSTTALTAKNARVVKDGNLVGSKVLVVANAAGAVTFEPPMLDSARALRDRPVLGFDDRLKLREEMQAPLKLPANAIRPRLIESSPKRLVLERESLGRRNGAPHHLHRMVVEAGAGTTLSVDAGGNITMSGAGKPRVEVAYLSDLPQLTPYAPMELLAGPAQKLLRADLEKAAAGLLSPSEVEMLKSTVTALEDLSSLVYKEKALAGGWRFLTYFGRDTLQTIQMLRPILNPKVVESVLEAALERLSPTGKVAHEEALLDEAAHERLKHAKATGASVDPETMEDAINDYKMVDDDFMLVSVLYEHLSDPNYDPQMREEFITRNHTAIAALMGSIADRAAPANRERIMASLAYVAAKARPFADAPNDPLKLIKFNDGSPVGDWRDSDPGNADGRFPGSVDVELVPTSLTKAASVARFLGLPSAELETRAASWQRSRKHFTITFTQEELRERVRWYLKEVATPEERVFFGSRTIEPHVHIDDFAAGSPLTGELAHGLSFPAIALDAEGKPIPVMTSDGLFGLLGSEARPEAVRSICQLLKLPYPLGLGTDLGPLITNAALCGNTELYKKMGPGKYHGTLIWPWLEALAISALSHQAKVLERAGYKEEADIARDTVRIVNKLTYRAGKFQTTELHGFGFDKDGIIEARPFEGAANEPYDSWPGNATQLWATALPLLKWARSKKLV